MNSFKDISEAIKLSLDNKASSEEVKPGAFDQAVDAKGMPIITGKVIGIMASVPGSENVLLNTATFQLMECISTGQRGGKKRSCIVEKGVYPKYGNQYVNSEGFRTHIVTKEVFSLVLMTLSSASKQLKDMQNKLVAVEERADLYKLMVDAFKKNGLID